MHHLDLGLFHYQIEYTQELLKELYGNLLIDEMDKRISAIPQFSGLKIFTNGLQTLARLTANEYRNLMKIMVFVVDNLHNENNKIKDLVILYEMWNDMYLISRYEEFKESDLIKFEVYIIFFNFYAILRNYIILYNNN